MGSLIRRYRFRSVGGSAIFGNPSLKCRQKEGWGERETMEEERGSVAGGFLGSWLVNFLHSNGYKVVHGTVGDLKPILGRTGGQNDGSLNFNAGFIVPECNAFGHTFRNYEKESEGRASVEELYHINHINQTYNFAKGKKEEYAKVDKAVMSIWECCELLNEYVDESDPDLDEPQIEHLLQIAEAIRRDYPDQDWLHLTALIHDLGKVLLHPSFGEQPQWCVVGDTFPLGCAFDESIVHHQQFMENPDYCNPAFSTRLGIYSENCGLDKVTMSWGHDEYMHLVMTKNKTTLPPAAHFIVRFHSFYPLHQAGAYSYLMNDGDKEMLKWLHVFNKYDLYSKSKVRINQEEVKPYYLSLIDKVRISLKS